MENFNFSGVGFFFFGPISISGRDRKAFPVAWLWKTPSASSSATFVTSLFPCARSEFLVAGARPPPAGRPRLARAACSFRQGRPSVSRGPPGLRRRVFVCPFLVSHRFSARRFELCSHILCLFFHMNFSITWSSQRKKSKTSHFYWPRVNIINELEEN